MIKKFFKKYYLLLISVIIVAIIITANMIEEETIQNKEKLVDKPQKETKQLVKKKEEKKEMVVTKLRAVEKIQIPVHSNSSRKLWMDYRAITNTNSIQWQLIQKATIGNDGILRIDGYVCVALGRSYGKLGDKFVFQIGNKKIKCIFTDMKADSDTLNGEGWLDPYGNILEIIVDRYQINSASRAMGDMNYTDTLSGKIIRIWKEK